MFLQCRVVHPVVHSPHITQAKQGCQFRSSDIHFYSSTSALSRPGPSSRRRLNTPRRRTSLEAENQLSFIEKVMQSQAEASKGQQEILQAQHGIRELVSEMLKLQQQSSENQHNNYHSILETTAILKHTVEHVQSIQEDVQVSDKIAFAAGFGCGLLVCLTIWISPFGGKDKDDDAEK